MDGIDEFMGYRTSAGALTVGIKRVLEEGLLPDTNFTYVVNAQTCFIELSGFYLDSLLGPYVVIGDQSFCFLCNEFACSAK